MRKQVRAAVSPRNLAREVKLATGYILYVQVLSAVGASAAGWEHCGYYCEDLSFRRTLRIILLLHIYK